MHDDVVVVDVAKQVQAAIKQHLWYFWDILNGLAFFDQEEETETLTKLAMDKTFEAPGGGISIGSFKEKNISLPRGRRMYSRHSGLTTLSFISHFHLGQ